jgi:hypothetical protein
MHLVGLIYLNAHRSVSKLQTSSHDHFEKKRYYLNRFLGRSFFP